MVHSFALRRKKANKGSSSLRKGGHGCVALPPLPGWNPVRGTQGIRLEGWKHAGFG